MLPVTESQVNLFNPNLKALSSFDATHNFVISYNAQLCRLIHAGFESADE